MSTEKTMKTGEKDLLLFEGSVLGFAEMPGQARSGIFVETFEVFRQFLRRKIPMMIMCDILMFPYMKKTINKYFSGDNIEVMYYVRWKQSLGGESEADRKIRHLIKCFCFLIITVPLDIINRINGKKRKAMNAAAFLSTAYAMPEFILKNDKIKKFLCLQDAIPLLFSEYYPQMKDKHYWYNEMIVQINDRNRYFAISQSTKSDILRLFPDVRPEQIDVIYLGKDKRYVNKGFLPDDIKAKYHIGEISKYFFSLCTLEPRKNLIRSIKCFLKFIKDYDIQDLVYVIAGGNWKKFRTVFDKEFVTEELYKEKVYFIGYVEDDDLPYLYSGAECFVFTSQYEGFGLPVLEAMSCGCPVITSNSSSLPEVIGQEGISIQWDSDEEHIEAYYTVYTDMEMRNRLRTGGMNRAKSFSWEECADKMLKVMNECNG